MKNSKNSTLPATSVAVAICVGVNFISPVPATSNGLLSDTQQLFVESTDELPTSRLESALSRFDVQLRKQEKMLRELLGRVGDATEFSADDAYKYADRAIGIGDSVIGYLSEGGLIDQRMKEADQYLSRAAQIISENDTLSDNQRADLLADVSHQQNELELERGHLRQKMNTIATLTAKARKSREYLAMAKLVESGASLVRHIKELNATLDNIASVLRDMASDPSAPAG